MPIHVTVWTEDNYQDALNERPQVLEVYPQGLNQAICDAFKGHEDEFVVRSATLPEPEAGLTDELLDDTDVLVWWGHCKHGKVPDEIVARVQRRVLRGMGLIVLHSGHESKIFKCLMGTQCSLRWHEMRDKERIFVIEPSHPIMRGVPAWFELPAEEMYGERFDIPAPDALLAIGWYETGEVFRSACCFTRGYGKVFYFQPGHETLDSFHNEYVQLILRNAAHFTAQDRSLIRENLGSHHAIPALEPKRDAE